MQLLERLSAAGDRVLGRWPQDELGRGALAPDPLTDEGAAVFLWIVRATWVLVALQCVLHLCDAALFDLQIARLDADSDKSVWSWLGSASELAAGGGAALLWLTSAARRRALAFLTATLVFFSMDDTVRVHEGLGNLRVLDAIGGSARIVWPVLYAPIMIVTCLILWRASGAMATRCRAATRVGLVLLGSAVLLEFAVSTVIIRLGYGRVDDDTRVGSMLYEYEVVVEEAFELAGWLLIAAALLATGVDVLTKRGARDGERPR